MQKRRFVVLVGVCAVSSLALGSCALETADSGESVLQTESAVSTKKLAADCEAQCTTSQALGCGESIEECVAECLYVEPIRPECMNPYADFIECAAGLDEDGFVCSSDGEAALVSGCPDEFGAVVECQRGPSPQGWIGLCRAQCNHVSSLECALPDDACYEQCMLTFGPLGKCDLEGQKLLICANQVAPEEWACDPEYPELGPLPFISSCFEDYIAWAECFFGYPYPAL